MLGAALPGGQAVGAVEPATQLEPTGHGVQPLSEARLVAFEYRPAGQGSGTAAPAAQWWPDSHSRQPVAPVALW